MDNCRFHHSVEVLRILYQNGITYKFLKPYFPQLNYIDEFFAELKANYKRIRPPPNTRAIIKERIESLMLKRYGNFVRHLKSLGIYTKCDFKASIYLTFM